MENGDLISFNCSSSLVSPILNAPVANTSPGNNPFDDLVRNLNSSSTFTTPIVQINDLSEDLMGFLSGDFGRESLILGRNSLLPSDLNIKSSIGEITDDNTEMNVAFLCPKLSTASTLSGFSSKSLNSSEISKIYSVSSVNGVHDEAFANTLQYVNQQLNEHFSPGRNRIQSLPVQIDLSQEQLLESKAFSFGGAPTFHDNYNIIDDSVFIEAKHLASRIENQSIFDQSINDCDSLDKTTPPIELTELLDESQPEIVQEYNKEKVYKTIDKMLPTSNSKSSKDAKEILQDLSEIFNSENRSDQQAQQGQQLLSSLASILKSSNSNAKSSNSDDSGHSSIYELGPKQTTSASELTEQPLDLSLKKRLSNSFNLPNCKLLPKINSNQRKSSSLDSTQKSDSSRHLVKLNDFKPKKVQEPQKKGPVKAMVPISQITKKNTPPKRLSQVFKYKKTSTPINESKLKPVAQSTPDGPANKLIKKKCSLSPLMSTNSSLSKLNTALQKPSLAYRSSTSDLRKSLPVSEIKRSNSTGKDPKIMSVLNRVRDSFKLNKTETKIGSVRKSNKENAGHLNY